jgi:hypothetical protein
MSNMLGVVTSLAIQVCALDDNSTPRGMGSQGKPVGSEYPSEADVPAKETALGGIRLSEDSTKLGDEVQSGDTAVGGESLSGNAAVGEEGPSRDKAARGKDLSGDAAVSSRGLSGGSGKEMCHDKGTRKEKLGNDTEELEELTLGDQATSMFKSAVRETLQIKKMDLREMYTFYLHTALVLVSNS